MMAAKKLKIVMAWLLVPVAFTIGVLLLQNLVSQDQSDFPQKPLSRKSIKKIVDGPFRDGSDGKNKKHGSMSNTIHPEASWPITSVAIEMPAEKFKQIQKVRILREHERRWLRCFVSWNNVSNKTSAKIKLHGWTTLGSPKKSFSMKLKTEVPFTSEIHLSRFFLINMVHDKGRFHGWFSYAFLQQLGLFPNYFQYITVDVNGKSQGIYLLIERTADALLRTQDGLQFVMRRRTDKLFASKYMRSASVDTSAIDFLINAPHSSNQKDLAQTYDQVLDIDLYLTWLVYNTLVQIPDTQDELFFYQTADFQKGLSKLKIAAWDYDLLFDPKGGRTPADTAPLLSGMTCQVGYMVGKNPHLLSRYKKLMRRLLMGTFTKDSIENMLNQIKVQQRQISENLPDQEKEAFLQSGQNYMERFKANILQRRTELLSYLKN